MILIFGDAPPHNKDQALCEQLAAEFRRKQKGIVNTISCRHSMPEFDGIAEAGGGESYLSGNERELMTKLVVLVFGSRHHSKVVEAFKLMER